MDISKNTDIEVHGLSLSESIVFIAMHIFQILVVSILIAAILKYIGIDVFIESFHLLLNYEVTNFLLLGLAIAVTSIIIYIIIILLKVILSAYDRIKGVITGDLVCVYNKKSRIGAYVTRDWISSDEFKEYITNEEKDE